MKYKVCSSYGDGNLQAISTVKDIAELDDIVEINFDFTNYKENNPFNNLIIASAINEYIKRNPETIITITPKSNNDYLCHLGFYDMMGMDYGKKIGEAKPNNNYVPITIIDLREMRNDFYGVIEHKAKQLSALLKYDKDFSEFLTYTFIETIRNVYEHADTDIVYICAQKWQSMNLVEIAIVDNGCGVAHALGKRIKGKNELELLRLAALPGISAMSNHTYLEKDDSWRNSGYGLYALRRLSNLYEGSFMLCSGNYCLYQYGSTKKIETNFKGTAIALRIKTNTDNNFKFALNDVISKGQLKAKAIADSIKKASKSSGGSYNN